MSRNTDMKPERQAHRNFTRRYWKEMANSIYAVLSYSEENINRMKMGKAPRRLACLENKKTGEKIEFHAPVELHHVFGINSKPPEEQTVVELYPWQHAEIDDDRKFNWSFVEWRGFQ